MAGRRPPPSSFGKAPIFKMLKNYSFPEILKSQVFLVYLYVRNCLMSAFGGVRFERATISIALEEQHDQEHG
jgi:hypothetical protein